MTLNVMPFVIINKLMASLILNGLIEPNANRLSVYTHIYTNYEVYTISFSRWLTALIGRATVVKKEKKRPTKAGWPGGPTCIREYLLSIRDYKS